MSYYRDQVDISVLLGKTLTKFDVDTDTIYIETSDDKKYKMYHEQDCCERVWVEDVCGDVSDLVGSEILEASEEVGSPPPGAVIPEYDTQTWTFYKLGTRNGSVTIRWCGQSNGYYSERVTLIELK